MSRIIKFRGLRTDGGGWVYGSFVKTPERCDIHVLGQNRYTKNFYTSAVEVLPETIGQYTGMTLKNGVDIYEGDIVGVKGTKKVGKYITTVVWFKNGFQLKENKTFFNDTASLIGIYEVISNIHETK